MADDIDSANVTTVTPRQLFRFLCEVLEAGLVPMVVGDPGIGKSAIIRMVCLHYALKLIDHRLSTSAPEDLSGIPMLVNGRARFVPFAELFPIQGDEIPAGYQGWFLFLDELNSAIKTVLAAAFKLILDRMVGQANLHSNVMVAAAGNLDTSRGITTVIPTPLKSRMVWFRLEVSHSEWMEDVGLKQNYDQRILSFLQYKPDYLMDFRADSPEQTYCCPRTWEFMNRLMVGRNPDGTTYRKEVTDDRTALYAGTITSGVAAEFVAYTKVFSQLPRFADIVADPKGMKLPDRPELRYATVSHLLSHVDQTSFDKVSDYMARMPFDFRVMFYRWLGARDPAWRRHPVFASAMREMQIVYVDDDGKPA